MIFQAFDFFICTTCTTTPACESSDISCQRDTLFIPGGLSIKRCPKLIRYFFYRKAEKCNLEKKIAATFVACMRWGVRHGVPAQYQSANWEKLVLVQRTPGAVVENLPCIFFSWIYRKMQSCSEGV